MILKVDDDAFVSVFLFLKTATFTREKCAQYL